MSDYLHGHHESVLSGHRRRTAEDCCAYLLPHLSGDESLLDVGCGPGTITVGLAQRLPRGHVLGIDPAADAVAEATDRAAQESVPNIRIEQADVETLPAGPPFDVVHAHQVLQHVTDPMATLRTMAARVRPGGLVAVRDADYAAMSWWPLLPALDEWRAVYRAVAHALGAEPDAGRRLPGWCRAAGLRDIEPSLGTWLYATASDRERWAAMWAARATQSDLATHALRLGLADPAGLERIAAGWRAWGADPDGWLAIVHGQVLARV